MSPECAQLQERVDELEGKVIKLTEYIYETILVNSCSFSINSACNHPERKGDACGDYSCPILNSFE